MFYFVVCALTVADIIQDYEYTNLLNPSNVFQALPEIFVQIDAVIVRKLATELFVSGKTQLDQIVGLHHYTIDRLGAVLKKGVDQGALLPYPVINMIYIKSQNTFAYSNTNKQAFTCT